MKKHFITIVLLFISIHSYSVNKWYKYQSGTATYGTLANWYLDQACTIPAAELPRATDSVAFVSGDCAISVPALCYSANFMGYTGSLTGGSTWAISGQLLLVPGMTWNLSGTITFNAITTGWKIMSAGKSFQALIFNGVGGGWTFQDNVNVFNSMTLTAGTLSFGNRNVTVGGQFLCSGTGVRTIDLGSGNFIFTMTGISMGVGPSVYTFIFDCSISTNLTVSATTGTIKFTKYLMFSGGGKTYGKLQCLDLYYSVYNVIKGANIFKDIIFISNNISQGAFIFLDNQTCIDTLTITGASRAIREFIRGKTSGSRITLTATTYVFNNVDFQNINLGSLVNLSGKDVGNAGNNANITFPIPVGRYWRKVGGTGNWSSTTSWSATSGGSTGASIPLPGDTAYFDAVSFAVDGKTVLGDVISFPAINFTNISHTIIFNLTTATPTILCNSINTGGHVTGGIGYYWFMSSNNDAAFNLTGTGNIYCYLDFMNGTATISGVNTTNVFICYTGTFMAGGDNTISSLEVDPAEVGIPTINLSSYSLTLTADQRPFNLTSANTFICGTSTVKITGTPVISDKYIGLEAAKTFYNLQFQAVSVPSAYWTFNYPCDITVLNNLFLYPDSHVKFPNGRTVFLSGTLSATGTSGHKVYLRSNSSGTITFSKASGDPCLDYIDLYNVTITPITAHAGANSTSSGINSGWVFSSCFTVCDPLMMHEF